MTELQDDGNFSISGAHLEVKLIDPTGVLKPRTIFELNGIQWARERQFVDVPLPGNRSGSKMAGITHTGTMDIRKVDDTFETIAARVLDLDDIEARRAARDAGQAIRTDITLQVWLDDPDSLGRIGHELTGVRLGNDAGGSSITEPVIGRQYPFRFRKVRQLESVLIAGAEVNEVTGLPVVTRVLPS